MAPRSWTSACKNPDGEVCLAYSDGAREQEPCAAGLEWVRIYKFPRCTVRAFERGGRGALVDLVVFKRAVLIAPGHFGAGGHAGGAAFESALAVAGSAGAVRAFDDFEAGSLANRAEDGEREVFHVFKYGRMRAPVQAS